MCEECDGAGEPLREVYLARRARMARTWAPHRPWPMAAPVAAADPSPPPVRADDPVTAS